MRARGMSQIEIAQQLQVSRASIGFDVQYLREPYIVMASTPNPPDGLFEKSKP
jgi:DNA-binding transcriptional regulator LsrR (DeoR family)